MYSKQESSKLKEAFWTAFGKYMAPVPSAEGIKINWVNYKTGFKNIRFYMEGNAKNASIGIKIFHEDPEIQQLLYEEFLKLKPQLRNYLQEDWTWNEKVKDINGKSISSISTKIDNINIFKQDDWPTIISFLKPRLIAMDAFWSEWKYNFDGLL